MNNVRGMTITEFNEVLDEMRTVYAFDENETYLSDLSDLLTNSQRRVEIVTQDKETGIQIVMSKAVKLNVSESN